MHIVFGGAFNGKRQFVRGLPGCREAAWFEGELPRDSIPGAVVAGLELWVKRQLENGTDERELNRLVQDAIAHQRPRQIWILTDINRGIVPADPLERELRDVLGRLYQQLFLQAASVTRIWYGIPETLKGADLHENLHKNGR
ncbi:adenosyl cobinamide kinase/adenosyl cobinamide phosphate guanylyltransferase [Planomicrobium koreense]|uniref:Adenosyl cobinamide kinase/adenosyl cobinamide phosphate guanylyltransferase n=1 Tax=Planococcus koreensis TaxID=112331 RepID=A0A7W8CQB2_9BACL|nr:bifunctional adenosylcobinamide kinase/adenosylcobinamide-phosphate guanylyltransferase [Planococcus koreensis]MBB5179491.1 adenosyl cobinamide kinase/adenosyl cobinamide phosphate guanylyltransferase [Planococcus koreensis]